MTQLTHDIQCHQKEIAQKIVEQIESMIKTASMPLRMAMHHGDVYLSAPQIVIDYFIDGYLDKYKLCNSIKGKPGFTYNGVIFIPSHKMELVLFHRDFLLHNDARFVVIQEIKTTI